VEFINGKLMRRLVLLLVLLTSLFFASLLIDGNSQSLSNKRALNLNVDGVRVYYFYGEGCPVCAGVKPFIDAAEGCGLSVERFEVYGNRSNMLLLQDYFDKFNVPKCRRGVPAVFTSDSYLVGSGIAVELHNFVNASRQAVSNEAEAVAVDNAAKAGEFDGFSLLTLTVAALVDSVNPCSMAILFFLMAGLLMFRKREKALKVGLAFTLSVFVANLLFGLGILTAIGITSFSSMFKVVAGAVAIVTGVLLVKDCFWYRRGGFTMEVPSFLKPYLKRRLSRAFFGKDSSILAAFAIGFLVSSFEVPCTGGPYFYVLASVADEALRLQTLPVLLYYNLVFVLPLLVITALLYFGSVHVERARGWQERNKPLINLGRGLPMIAVGFLTIPMQNIIQFLKMFLFVYRVVYVPAVVILIFYIAFKFFSRSENRDKAFRGVTVGVLAVVVLFASTYAQIGLRDVRTLSLGSVVVAVRYVDGTPVEGAGIRVYKDFNVPPELNVSSGFTNATGQFKAASLPYCNYTYWVETLMSDGVISYVPVRVDETCVANVVVNPLKGDINGDGVVNVLDLSIVGIAFDSYPGHPKWNPLADLKKDNKINVLDLSVVGINYGKEALTGCVNVKVQFYDGTPIEGAEVFVNGSKIGLTDSSGIVQNCSVIGKGDYTVKAYYGGTQYGKDASMTVNECGVGNALIDGKGCATIRVVDANENPVGGNEVWLECMTNFFGTTNAKGIVQKCEVLSSGDHVVDAPNTVGYCFADGILSIDSSLSGFKTIRPPCNICTY
jgi:cytochrome c biogenesis protein CcdA